MILMIANICKITSETDTEVFHERSRTSSTYMQDMQYIFAKEKIIFMNFSLNSLVPPFSINKVAGCYVIKNNYKLVTLVYDNQVYRGISDNEQL